MSRSNWVKVALFGALLAVAALLIGLLWPVSGASNDNDDTPPPSGDDNSVCWEVVRDADDAGGDVLEDGFKGSPEEVSAKYMAIAKQDPSALVGLYNMSPLAKKGKLSENDVASDGCYTAKGRQAWYALGKELAKSDRSNGEAPGSGCNTFVENGKVVVKCGKISGDRKGTKIIWADGTVTWIMHRCLNPVTPGNPDNPPPPPCVDEPGNPCNPPPPPCVDEPGNPCNPPPEEECPPGTVPYEDRCVKPAGQNDPGGSGGNDSPAVQPVDENPQGPTDGAPTQEPPPPDHNGSEDDNGSPGDGGAPAPTEPDDDSDSGQTTSPSPTPAPGVCTEPEEWMCP